MNYTEFIKIKKLSKNLYLIVGEEKFFADKVEKIIIYPNIIIKFGRFIPDDIEYFNEDLGVNLASKNQYVVRFANENNTK